MKKNIILTIIVLLLILLGSVAYFTSRNKKDSTFVGKNGWLVVDGSNLLNSSGEPIQLRGISSHGIQWYQYSKSTIKALKDTMKINVFRIAMWTDPNHNGYVKNPGIKDYAIELIDYAIELDLYVIIDWHILEDDNPNTYKEEAKEFFDEISNKYKNVPNVIYEICNEPSGTTNWKEGVKPYAEEIIPVIRKNSPKSLIIVGTPEWCRDLNEVLASPLDYKNIVYAVHFYSGSNKQELRDVMDNFLDNGLAIFVSECGMTNYMADGPLYIDEFETWIEYLDQKNISWVYWSIAMKDETSSILDPNKDYFKWDIYGNFIDPEDKDLNDYLSESGKEIHKILNSYQ